MNEDYLWDKSGQPDPEIQRLEEILGELRYRSAKLEIPNNLPAPRRRSYFPLLAIAATVLMALLAGGIWLRVRQATKSPKEQATGPAAVEEKAVEVVKEDEPVRPKETVVVNNTRRHKIPNTRLERREREEAIAAKEQLMVALRLASEKLNLAHRKTQNTTPANQIKNQHRIG